MTPLWTPYLASFRPVMQEVVDPQRGDCMAACVASILGLDRASEVPSFHARSGYEWLSLNELWLRYRHLSDGQWWESGGVVEPGWFPGYAVAHVDSQLFPGGGHAVVVLDGVVVHDPSPVPRVAPYVARVYFQIVCTRGETQELRARGAP